MWINVYALNMPVLQDSVKIRLMRCLDRGCTLDMKRTNQKLQVQLEAMYTGPRMLLEERCVCFHDVLRDVYCCVLQHPRFHQ